MQYDFVYYFFLIFKNLFIYFERDRVSGGGAERGRERIPGRLHTVSAEPNVGLELRNCKIMTEAKIKSQVLNQLSHPGAPEEAFYLDEISTVHVCE